MKIKSNYGNEYDPKSIIDMESMELNEMITIKNPLCGNITCMIMRVEGGWNYIYFLTYNSVHTVFVAEYDSSKGS